MAAANNIHTWLIGDTISDGFGKLKFGSGTKIFGFKFVITNYIVAAARATNRLLMIQVVMGSGNHKSVLCTKNDEFCLPSYPKVPPVSRYKYWPLICTIVESNILSFSSK